MAALQASLQELQQDVETAVTNVMAALSMTNKAAGQASPKPDCKRLTQLVNLLATKITVSEHLCCPALVRKAMSCVQTCFN